MGKRDIAKMGIGEKVYKPRSTTTRHVGSKERTQRTYIMTLQHAATATSILGPIKLTQEVKIPMHVLGDPGDQWHHSVRNPQDRGTIHAT